MCPARGAPRRLRRGREQARMCPARGARSVPPAGYGGDVSGQECVPLAMRGAPPAYYGEGVSGHACVLIATRRAHIRRLLWGRERARVCPARGAQSAPPSATAERTPAG